MNTPQYFLLFLPILGIGCAHSPTGRSQLILVKNSQMTELGAAAFEEIKQKTPATQDEGARNFVRCVAAELVRDVGGNWDIEIFQDDTPNAFALPGGKIGVNTGLLTVTANQDQLAAVIGHEIAHVKARHGAERVSQASVLGAGVNAVSAAMGNSETHDIVVGALGLGATVGVLQPFSRTHESEADEIGQLIMARAGFNPEEAIRLWENMAAKSGSNVPEFLSTHPSHETRQRDLRNNLPKVMPVYEEARANGRAPQCAR